MNALNPDCQKRPLKMTGNEIKCLSHFQLCSKIFLAIRHNYQVSELCRGLHARCLVVPATVTFQTIQQIFQLQNDQSFIQSSGSMKKHGCDSDFSFLKNVNCGHLKKPNLPKYPPQSPMISPPLILQAMTLWYLGYQCNSDQSQAMKSP